MYAISLAPDEPLSPELVLVLPPELRAQALARLRAPAWAQPRARGLTAPLATRTLGRIVVARAVQLAQIFLAITILILAMSAIAKAIR